MARRFLAPIKGLGSSGILALSALLLALNLAGSVFYLRFDLSEGKVYSVSLATKRILKSLKDPVIVKAYFSHDLPEPYATHREYLRDLLRAYKNYGGKNFEYRFVSYPNDEDLKREALTQGIAPVQLTYISKDKYEVKDGFMGAVIVHGDKRESIAVIRDLDGLEYDITSRIKKLITKEPVTIAILKDKGAQPLPQELEAALKENYEIKDWRLSEPVNLDRLPKSLLVIGPRESFSDADLAKLEQMLLRGVAGAFFIDTKNVDIQGGSFFARPLDTGLDRLLGQWGVSIGRAFVLDIQNQNISIQQRAGPYMINNIIGYPLIPIVTALNQDSPITKGMDHLTAPFISPIATSSVKGVELNVLAYSTRLSWSKTDFVTLSPMSDFAPDEKDPRGPFALAVSAAGKWNALFKVPPSEIEKEGGFLSSQWLAESAGNSRVVIFGTSQLLDPRISMTPTNQVFVLNAMDWLSQDSDLIAIRSKGVKIRPFTINPSYWLRQLIKCLALFGMPVMIVILGLGRWQSRRRWKQRVREMVLAS